MTVDLPPPALSSDVCVIVAAKEEGVPVDLMLAVRSVERGTPGKFTTNTNGTRDFNEPGLNTGTIKELANQGWNVPLLIRDGCYGMRAASYWMRTKLLNVQGSSLPLLARAARYNSATKQHNENYQNVLVPKLADWSCHVYHHWKVPASALFAVASQVTTEEELKKCKPQRNLR